MQTFKLKTKQPSNPYKDMLSHFTLKNEEEDEGDSANTPTFCWWRSAQEFGQNGQLNIKFSTNLSKLTPRLKVLRELERLALVAPEGLDDLRHKLLSYRSGDLWLPTGGLKKEGMDIPPIVTLLLVGFSGSGKSSLVNLMYSVLGRSGLIPFAQTSGSLSDYTTMFMEERNVLRSVRSGFCVYDSRGFDYKRLKEGLEKLMEWMVDGIYHHQLCWRDVHDWLKREGQAMLSMESRVSRRFKRRRVNCPMVVVNVAEVYKGLMKGDFNLLEATKELFHCPAMRICNENPILILTHGDMLTTEERIDGRIKICETLGISETTGTYDITCLTEFGFLADESDPVTAYALTEAIYRALLFSDRSYLPKRNLKDWLMLCISWILWMISSFFGFLGHLFCKLSQKSRLKM